MTKGHMTLTLDSRKINECILHFFCKRLYNMTHRLIKEQYNILCRARPTLPVRSTWVKNESPGLGFILAYLSVKSTFSNGLKGSGTMSCRRRGTGFYWRPRLPGMRQDILRDCRFFIHSKNIVLYQVHSEKKTWMIMDIPDWLSFFLFLMQDILFVRCTQNKKRVI